MNPDTTPKWWHQRWPVRIAAGLAVLTAGLAVASATTSHPAAAKTPAPAPAPAPAITMPVPTSPAALTPAAAVNAWWSATGHRDTDTVQADTVRITGDFRGQPAAKAAADGQQLADDALAAMRDYQAARNVDHYAGWEGPQATAIAGDWTTAMANYRAAGIWLAQGTAFTDSYTGHLGGGQEALRAANTALTALHLPPSVVPGIDSPDA